MDEPRQELNADDSDAVPAFDELTPPEEVVRGERTRDDFLDAALQLAEPATVEEVADLAGHGTDAAREYLAFFERMGVVARVTDAPATYRRNQEFLEWRRVQRLRQRYGDEELVDRLDAATERDRAFAEEFSVASPDGVSISEHSSTDRSIEEVWSSLSEWKTTRRRIRLLERALAADSGRRSDGARSTA